MIFQEWLKIFDLMQFKPGLYYKRKEFYQSTYGGAMCVFTFLILFAMLVIILQKFVMHSQYQINNYKETYQVKGQNNPNNITIFFQIYDLTTHQKISEDDSLFKVSLQTGLTVESRPLFSWINDTGSELNITRTYSNLYESSASIFRNMTHFSYVKFSLTKCNEDFRVKCKSEEEINKILSNSYLYLKLPINYFDVKSGGVKNFYKEFYYTLIEPNFNRIRFNYLRKEEIRIDNSLFLDSEYETQSGNFFQFEETNTIVCPKCKRESFDIILGLTDFYIVKEFRAKKIFCFLLPEVYCLMHLIYSIIHMIYVRLQKIIFFDDFTECIGDSSLKSLKDAKTFAKDTIQVPLGKEKDSTKFKTINSPSHGHIQSNMNDQPSNLRSRENENIQEGVDMPTVIRMRPEGGFSFNSYCEENSSISFGKNSNPNIQVMQHSPRNKGVFIHKLTIKSDSKNVMKPKLMERKSYKMFCCFRRLFTVNELAEFMKRREISESLMSVDEIARRLLEIESFILKCERPHHGFHYDSEVIKSKNNSIMENSILDLNG